MMSAKNLTLALSVALVLSATGCASLKGKDTASIEAAQAAQAQAEKDKAAADAAAAAAAEEARLSALKNKDGINASGLDGGTDSSATSGTGGKDTSSGGVTMADMLNVRLVHFDYDSSDLSSEDLQTLQAHAQYLSQNPNAKVLLAGHADERGTREYNMALGERRANAVLAFLSSNGAKSSQLDSVSYGKEKPLNDGHDEGSWAENRRVEITYKTGAPQ